MPLGNGTGPTGAARGLGQGDGRGRQSGGFGLGPDGECICPNCKTKASHQRGVPCFNQKCSKCGSLMTRSQ